MSKRLILYFLVFLTIGFIVFWYWSGHNFSKEVLKLEILGPQKSEIGKEIEYAVKYKNNGNFALRDIKVVFELPENSLTEDGKIRFEQSLQDINPGQEELVKFKGRLLGKDGDLKIAKARLSYVPNKLSVRYESTANITTKIDDVPIVIKFNTPQRIQEGQALNWSISYSSEVDYPLENASIKIGEIEGFKVKSASPSSLDNSEWKIGTLSKGSKGIISISGTVSGLVSDRINFSAKLGVWRNGSFIVIKESSQSVALSNLQNQISISQEVNGSANHIASAGQILSYKITIYNAGSTPLSNIVVKASLQGSAFDFSVFGSEEGTVQSSDKSIFFNSNQAPQLSRIEPKGRISVSFAIALKKSLTSESDRIIRNVVTAAGATKEFANNVNLGTADPSNFGG